MAKIFPEWRTLLESAIYRMSASLPLIEPALKSPSRVAVICQTYGGSQYIGGRLRLERPQMKLGSVSGDGARPRTRGFELVDRQWRFRTNISGPVQRNSFMLVRVAGHCQA